MEISSISNLLDKKYRFHLSSYSQLIVLIGLLLVSGVWLFTYQQINLDYERTIEETSSETMNLTIFFEEHVKRTLTNVDHDLLTLKSAYEQNGTYPLFFDIYAKTMKNYPSQNPIMIINEEGNMIHPLVQDIVPMSFINQEFFQIHKTTMNNYMYIGKPLVNETNGLKSIVLSQRINKADGSFGGIIYINLNLNYFFDFYNKINLGPNHLISLIDTTSFNQIYQVDRNQKNILDITPTSLKNIQSPSTIRITNPLDGLPRIISYQQMVDYPLVVMVGKWEKVALNSYELRKRNFIIGATLRSLFVLFFCGLLIHRYEKTRRLTIIIQQEKDRLSAVINSINDEVWLANTNKIYTLTNPAVHQAFCIDSTPQSIEEVLMPLEILHADGSPLPLTETPSLRALQGEIIINEQQIIRIPATGEWRTREITANPVLDSNNKIIGSVAVIHDITERKIMEEELKKHRDHLQTLVEEQLQELSKLNVEMTAIFASISDPLYILDKEWRLTYVNKEVVQMNVTLNHTHIGQNIWGLFPGLVGSELYQKCYEANNTNKPIHTIFNDPRMNRWFDTHLYPYENGLFIYFRDVTEQKKYEDEIAKLDKLNIIGEMAAGIAHEIRNPMTTVQGYLQYYGRKTALADYHDSFKLMIEELNRANHIITNFLSLAKNQMIIMIPTDLNKVINNIFPLLQADALRRGNDIELDLTEIPEILADDKEIRQCILNLVINGLDAMPKGGTVKISTEKTENHIIVTVQDQGTGIPPEIKENLWVPFFTTKEHGTGLGLSICYRIAERHQATFEIETSPQGTAFHLLFPHKKIAE